MNPNQLKLEWEVGEVIDYEYTYSYEAPSQSSVGNTNSLFSIKVRTCGDYFNTRIITAKPGNISNKQIPLIGEFVLIYKTFNELTTTTQWRETWYYLTTISVQSSINENMLPGISTNISQQGIQNIKPGKTFKQRVISPLQPYEGDTLIEGRWSNSIRLGSSISTFPAGHYFKSATWSSKEPGDPIIVLSNGRNNKTKKEFVVEDLEQDASSLYLTSTQNLNTLKLSKDLTVHNGSFVGSQFVGVADRVILRAKQDIAVIDSQEGIVLNTPGDIYIGGEDATEPLTHGLVLQQIVQLLVQAIAAVSIGNVTNAATLLGQISDLSPNLNSTKYKITKT
jgi:hypothetical protein